MTKRKTKDPTGMTINLAAFLKSKKMPKPKNALRSYYWKFAKDVITERDKSKRQDKKH